MSTKSRAPKPAAVPAKAKRGRPKKVVDVVLLAKLAKIGCTNEEIATIAGVHRNTLANYCAILDKRAATSEKCRVVEFRQCFTQRGSGPQNAGFGREFCGHFRQREKRLQNSAKQRGPAAWLGDHPAAGNFFAPGPF